MPIVEKNVMMKRHQKLSKLKIALWIIDFICKIIVPKIKQTFH